MIKQGDVIKHKSFMDVAIQVYFANQHPDTRDFEVRGVWLNQGQTSTYSLNEPAEITIKKVNLNDWLKCSKPESGFLRIEEWKELK